MRISSVQKAFNSVSVFIGLHDFRKTSCLRVLRHCRREIFKWDCIASRDLCSSCAGKGYSGISQVEVGPLLHKDGELCGEWKHLSAQKGAESSEISGAKRFCRFVGLPQLVFRKDQGAVLLFLSPEKRWQSCTCSCTTRFQGIGQGFVTMLGFSGAQCSTRGKKIDKLDKEIDMVTYTWTKLIPFHYM